MDQTRMNAPQRKEQTRLDKYLTEAGLGSRSDVKKMIRSGRVLVNGSAAKSADLKVDPDTDEVLTDGQRVRPAVIPTLMLNKPAGVVSATKDAHFQTVTDLIREPWAGKLFPVGRLDKDTEGLLLLTTDGALSHGLLSPKRHVSKTYFAVISGAPDQSLVRHFREGFDIGEKRDTLPAGLCFLTAPEDYAVSEYAVSEYAVSEYSVSEYDTSEYAISAHAASIRPEDYARCGQDECCAVISITEGKFHQIKRMFGAFGREVRFLKRIAMGGLALDPSLSPGEWRPLTEEEMMLLGKGSAAEENRD